MFVVFEFVFVGLCWLLMFVVFYEVCYWISCVVVVVLLLLLLMLLLLVSAL